MSDRYKEHVDANVGLGWNPKCLTYRKGLCCRLRFLLIIEMIKITFNFIFIDWNLDLVITWSFDPEEFSLFIKSMPTRVIGMMEYDWIEIRKCLLPKGLILHYNLVAPVFFWLFNIAIEITFSWNLILVNSLLKNMRWRKCWHVLKMPTIKRAFIILQPYWLGFLPVVIQ